MTKEKNVTLSIRPTKAEYDFLLSEQQRLLAQENIEVSLNVLVMKYIRLGFEFDAFKRQELQKAEVK